MDLFHACMNHDWKTAIEDLNKMTGSISPRAIWAILMHVGAWHDEVVYDTPHSAILIHTIKRMIEELGPNELILDDQPDRAIIAIPDEIRENFQTALLERLVYYLSEVDHQPPGKGPQYGIEQNRDSLDNAMNGYIRYIRERKITGALAAALRLTAEESHVRVIRATMTLASEKPDKYGHTFILPCSLLSEIPGPEFTRPHEATLWQLIEFLVRKAPARQPREIIGEELKELAVPTSLKKYKNAFKAAVMEYGQLGHNAIFAHRIVEATENGFIDENTAEGLIMKLVENTGGPPTADKDWEELMGRGGTDWTSQPVKIKMIHSKYVRSWVSREIDEYWSAIIDFKSGPFEDMIPNINKEEWSLIRAAQYVLASLYGHPRRDHIMIFAQATWALADRELISPELAALQVHRMIRENINKE